MKKYLSFLLIVFCTLYAAEPIFSQQSEKQILSTLEGDTTDDEKVQLLNDLGSVGSKRSLKTLVKFLMEGESGKVRSAAARSLGKLSYGRTSLEKSFANEDKYVRQAIMEALANIGSKKSVKIFENGYKDRTNHTVRYWALIGLSKTGSKNHAYVFRKALNIDWEKPGGKEAALLGLGRFGTKSDWRYIEPFSKRAKESYVIAALQAGAMLKHPEVLEVIEKKMAHKNSKISRAAINALGKFKGYNTIATLIRFKKDHPNYVNMDDIHLLLKKNKASKKYAILHSRMNLRKESSNRSKIITVLDKFEVVEITSRQKRKFVITDKSSGEELEDFWYKVKNSANKSGFIFGGYITVVETYR